MSQWFDDNTKTLTDMKPSRRQALKAMGGLRFLLVVLVSFLALVLTSQSGHPNPVAAATLSWYAFTVNTTADTHDAHPGDGVCANSNGQCSLRAAIEEGDALPNGSRITITVPAGTYALTLGTLHLTANTITINGASSKTTTIKGNHTFGIMRIARQVSASLSQLTMSGGKANDGGGIHNGGTVSVSNSTLSGNKASDGGGSIYNVGRLSVSNSTLNGNSTLSDGGGIENNGGTVRVSNSTLSGNSALDGGGIYSDIFGTVRVSNSTLSGNSATGIGGGIENHGTVRVSNSTISGNKASRGGGIQNDGGTVRVSNSTLNGNKALDGGGGIQNSGGTVSVSNSTISGNSATGYGGGIQNHGSTVTLTGTIVANNGGSNCAGTITEGVGYNLDSGTSCGFSLGSDLTNTDPKLGPLGHHGGPTQTMALLQGSPAIDWVAASSCPPTDQRGQPRPDHRERTCDIGAYESSY